MVSQQAGWVLAACSCEPEIEHCATCDTRREELRLTKLEDAVERSCQAIYAQRQGYWPSETERARIAVALLANSGR